LQNGRLDRLDDYLTELQHPHSHGNTNQQGES
jgi:hypothetical protein